MTCTASPCNYAVGLLKGSLFVEIPTVYCLENKHKLHKRRILTVSRAI